MGWLDIPIDSSNIIIGSMIIGLAVDDTIHFFHRFQRDFRDSGDVRTTVRSTLGTTGTALLFTSIVLITGFCFIGGLGSMKNTAAFGFLTALGIGTAFAADILLSPALIALTRRSRSA